MRTKSKVRTLFTPIVCPNCKEIVREIPPNYTELIQDGSKVICVDCHCEFEVRLTCLTRVAEQRNGAEAGDSGLLSTKENESR